MGFHCLEWHVEWSSRSQLVCCVFGVIRFYGRTGDSKVPQTTRHAMLFIMVSQMRAGPPWPSGNDAWLPNVSSQVRVSAASPNGLAWSLYKCSALWWAVYGPSATKRPLGTIREEKGISSRFRISISSRYDLSC